MYAPFASEDMVQQALGRNLSRDTNNKPLYPLVARNDQDRDALEQWRQQKSAYFSQRAQPFEQTVQQMQSQHNLSRAQIRNMMGAQDFDKAQAASQRFRQQSDILRRLEIRSNENGQELSKLRLDQHKLYIIGHGGPGMNILAADEECQQGMASAVEVAAQLATGKLDKAFGDIRVVACYSADTREPTSFHARDLARAAKPDATRSGCLGLFGSKVVEAEPFAQTLSNELKKNGFQQPDVAGYHGAGVTFSSDHQKRRMLNGQQADIRASDVRQRFTPAK